MPFINEFIPDEDKPRYKKIEDLFRRKVGPVGFSSSRQWTIDREREIFLTRIKSGGEDNQRFSGYLFYWKGRLIYVASHLLETVGGSGTPRLTTYRIDFFGELDEPKPYFKPDLLARRKELIEGLTEAFNARRGAGVYVWDDDPYTAVLQFAEGV